MPEFIPCHTPTDVDDFTRGYLEAVEWLLAEEVNRDKLRGFSASAKAEARKDCAKFMADRSIDLAMYEAATGLDMAHAGHDFWLTRNGHGAGFWDRDVIDETVEGAHAALQSLSDHAQSFGEVYEYVERGWIRFD